jgi:hypothetical protein
VIRLVRGSEPSALAAKRAAKLAGARAALASGEKIEFTGYGDDGVKEALFQGQRRKCAYCEKPEEQAKYRPAEHYRPKSRYWWLAWTWENLLFACTDCNSDHKRDQFPLVDEAHRLAAEAAPPGGEQPLLIDPYDPTIDPMQEIEFRRDRVQGKERWKPYGITERGRATVRICGLDRAALIDKYNAHVRDIVRPKIESFQQAQETGNAQDIVRAWSRLLRGLFWSEQPFHALSRAALAILVSPLVRERYQLNL